MTKKPNIQHFFTSFKSADDTKHLFQQYSVEEIVSEIEAQLSKEKARIIAAEFTLQELSLFKTSDPSMNDYVSSFRQQVLKSTIFTTLEHLIYSTDPFIRSKSIYTVGKLYFPEKAEILGNAIPYFVEKYPEDIDILLFEYFWRLILALHLPTKVVLSFCGHQENPMGSTPLLQSRDLHSDYPVVYLKIWLIYFGDHGI